MTDPDQQWKYSYWLVSHRLLFRKIGKVSLIIIAALPWLFFFIYLTIYLLNISKTNQILTELGVKQIISQNISQPDALVKSEAQAFYVSPGTYDLAAKLKNTNDDFVGRFDYSFSLGGKQTETQTSFILPSQTRYLAATDFKVTVSGEPQAVLNLSDISWERLERLEDLPEVSFNFQNLDYSLVELSEDDSSNIQSRVTGQVTNQGVYGFKQVEVIIVLTFNDQTLAIAKTQLADFKSSSTKQLNFTWSHKYPLNTQVEAYAAVDVLDSNNLILP